MRKLLIILCLCLPFMANGQDIHFSQFYAAPMMVNPANTGNFNGSVRIGGQYRDQWGSVTIPYRTFAAYTDAGIQPKKAVNRFGIGFAAFNDQAGDGILTTNKLLASAAYHIGYTDKDAVRFALGIQGGIVQKTFDINRLYFDSQWNDYTFDQNIVSGENGASGRIQYADFSAGALLTLIPYEDQRYTLGFSASHINQPAESFLGDENTVGIRYTATAGAMFAIGGKANLQPQVYVSTQSKAFEVIAGANVTVPMSGAEDDKNALFFGLWNRYNDAVWFAAGTQFSAFTASISYDINISQLRTASSTSGGLEIAAVYIFGNREKIDPLKCPAY